MRKSEITRKTSETDITLSLNLDGSGKSSVNTGIGFMDHMLTIFARHGSFDVDLLCMGDTHVDGHHSAEDVGICLGEAFSKALGEARGIFRYGDVTLPMDEALVLCAVDISGRSHLTFDIKLPAETAGAFDAELLEEFLLAFTRKSGVTIHLRMLSGKNTHHIIEACFKALARALRAAVKINADQCCDIPSTKGILL